MMAAGFTFWGLFVVFGAIVIGYIFWMRQANKKD